MKFTVNGRYKVIDDLVASLESNCNNRLAVEYPEAYYHARDYDKGTVVINVDSSYVDYNIVKGHRFLGLNVCIDASEFYCHKPANSMKLEYGSKRREAKVVSCTERVRESTSSDSEANPELSDYETLELWEMRNRV